MPRVWAYVSSTVYEELERLASEEGVEVSKVVERILRDYVTGRLRAPSPAEQRLQDLEERVEKLEEQVRELRAALKLLLDLKAR